MERRLQSKRDSKGVSEASHGSSWWWLVHHSLAASFLCISLFAFLVRDSVSLHSYSGAGKPPKFGDFEAQRHWMEITINLPVKEWYRNSTVNDLRYWGLDYPPLTAYQSYVHGLLLAASHPESVALHASRGHESYLGKVLMRWTVLSSDLLIFFPAVLCYIVAYHALHRTGEKRNIAWHIAMILLNPCLILIDHGHFQYNCISLGLAAGAIAAILSDKDLLACVLFSLALNHKQMSAYFAPAFFGHLFGKCLRRQNPIVEVLKLGLAVLATFAIVWLPYLQSLQAVTEVLSRLAPFDRGIYEDYVANFWCTSSVLIKWKKLFTIPSMKYISLTVTVIAALPSTIQQIWAPSKQGFLYGLLNSSMAFYLFSYQVHEKSILLPLLAASLLSLEEPSIYKWLTHFGLLSMFPLTCRDELIVPYISLSALFFFLFYHSPPVKRNNTWLQNAPFKSLVKAALVAISIVLHIVYLAITPPKKYPFLFEAVIMLLCFSQFVFIAAYTNFKQWTFSTDSTQIDKEKKYL
ncbi:probable dolichyl pyrophosphate Man9GlcNAc2 alpha-1,3-glucosyltransferase [Impatiens glandulifera]|uniref:probable dolichyl pyrophosphate Man9GlcNAc2 alpha-1,3-glucosyltransferase n=1 Tax=Impatiens glandulifera TaxID=253017 RepID=UPI001FB0FCFC|nr:probable dolichyl pyrophosphate Man9GlcNAc2 alpha-1,3-glucosyltransferase [Impatiens glandulifera]